MQLEGELNNTRTELKVTTDEARILIAEVNMPVTVNLCKSQPVSAALSLIHNPNPNPNANPPTLTLNPHPKPQT